MITTINEWRRLNEEYRVRISRQFVFDSIQWHDNYLDLYPGYSPGADTNDRYDECYFETRERAEGYADELIELLDGLPDPIPVFRAIRAKSEEDIDKENLGESWSFSKDSAVNFGEHNGSNFLMSAKVHKRDVNWMGTVKAYTLFSGDFSADDENEIVVDESDKLFDLEIVGLHEVVSESLVMRHVDSAEDEDADEFDGKMGHYIQHEYAIVDGDKEIGRISWDENGNAKGIAHISVLELDEARRGSGIGTLVLKWFRKKAKQHGMRCIQADCVSQQSFFAVVKAYGRPDVFGTRGTAAREFTDYEQVKEYLPLKSAYNAAGYMHVDATKGVHVEYKI